MSISQSGGSRCSKEHDVPVASPVVNSVCAVTVTYGERQHLLRQVLVALLKERAIRNIVVVANGAQWDVQGLAGKLGPERIEVIDLKTNRGSAAGFAAGIKRACELKTDFIWLLDDDNQPQEKALSTLLSAYADLSAKYPKDSLALLAFRPDHQRAVAFYVPRRCPERRPSSFWRFHIFDVPYKLWRKTPWGRDRLRQEVPRLIEMTEAPYGGLLFHPSFVAAHGLPREDFVVYEDDTEFTYRVTRGGGNLWLVTAAKITDVDSSWHVKRHFGNSFRLWLQGGSDTRIYYGARNHTYLDRHCFACNRLVYWINRRFFCSIMWLFALFLGRTDRYRLLQDAIRDGLAGHLGVSPRFPLE